MRRKRSESKDGVIRHQHVAASLDRGSQLQQMRRTLPEGDYVRLEVSDTGCGMTEEVKAKIFDPFFTTKFAGRGLGLAVVQGIVRDHGGAINLVSAPGQGTTFQVFLPCAAERAQSSRSAIAQSAGRNIQPRSGTILVVEDEDVLRLAVSKVLRKRGFR